ncbi:SPOR domain-containing protein [Pseudoalteromonas sp. ZZD1]|uniref:SPOR domain-containing protein n=1 Tax=Pseudoalteromonas sp. ZZD1 TaxID=3139395 RepID=UPI003BA88B5C
MHIKQRVLPALILVTTALSGCANNNTNQVDNKPSLISDQQVKEYVEQWQQQQDSISRLAEMEGDLKLLIMALSSNSQLAQTPVELRSESVDVVHQINNMAVQPQGNTIPKTTNQPSNLLNDALPGAQLGLYLKPQLVKSQIARLYREYPQAFSQLGFVMTERKNKGVTLYGLRVGPFKDYTQANAFCLIAQKMGQRCLSAPFVGQPL